jgi:hypothetical protein
MGTYVCGGVNGEWDDVGGAGVLSEGGGVSVICVWYAGMMVWGAVWGDNVMLWLVVL